MIDKVIAIIEREIDETVTAATRLDSLALDSLGFLDLLLEIEKETGIPSSSSLHFQVVGDFRE